MCQRDIVVGFWSIAHRHLLEVLKIHYRHVNLPGEIGQRHSECPERHHEQDCHSVFVGHREERDESA